MSSEAKRKAKVTGLSTRSRGLSVMLGMFLLTLASLSYLPFLAGVFSNVLGKIVPEIIYTKDVNAWFPSNFPITALAAGVVLILFGLNGTAVSSAEVQGVGRLEFDRVQSPEEMSQDPEAKQELEEAVAAEAAQATKESSNGGGSAAPSSLPPLPGGLRGGFGGGAPSDGKGDFWEEGDFFFYKPNAVPGEVLARFFSAEASTGAQKQMPRNLTDLEYAYRKKNKGNPRWYFKLKTQQEPLILVTGRGQGNKVLHE